MKIFSLVDLVRRHAAVALHDSMSCDAFNRHGSRVIFLFAAPPALRQGVLHQQLRSRYLLSA